MSSFCSATELLALMSSSFFESEEKIKKQISGSLNEFLSNSIGDPSSIGIVLWSSMFYRFDEVAYSILLFLCNNRVKLLPDNVRLIVNHKNGAFINGNVVESPLHLAAFNVYNQSNNINLLLRLGADPWLANSNHQIPLEVAFGKLSDSSNDYVHKRYCYKIVYMLLIGMTKVNHFDSAIGKKFVDHYIFPRIIELNDLYVLQILKNFKFNFDALINFAHVRYANAKRCDQQFVEYFKKIALEKAFLEESKPKRLSNSRNNQSTSAHHQTSSSVNNNNSASEHYPQQQQQEEENIIFHKTKNSDIKVTIIGSPISNENNSVTQEERKYIFIENYENPYPNLNYEPTL